MAEKLCHECGEAPALRDNHLCEPCATWAETVAEAQVALEKLWSSPRYKALTKGEALHALDEAIQAALDAGNCQFYCQPKN